MTNSELQWHKFPVLDDGFICLVDCMGDDYSVVQAARVSYGAGTKKVSSDRDLIRYLMRHRHTTPFEMAELKFLVRVPMDCWRQWIRHRTACLSGDTILSFDAPSRLDAGGRGHFSRTVKEIYDLWHKGIRQERDASKKPHFLERVEPEELYTASELGFLVERDDVQIRQLVQRGSLKADKETTPMTIKGIWWHEYAESAKCTVTYVPIRERIRNMSLRMLNEGTGEIEATRIQDIWSNGVKEVIRVEFSNGGWLRATEDHLCYTEEGWLKLGEALNRGVRFYATSRNDSSTEAKFVPFTDDELRSEEWRPVIAYGNVYQVSSLGRVRSRNRRGRTSTRLSDDYQMKELTRSGYRFVVGLSVNGETKAYRVAYLVAEAFLGPRPDGAFVCHVDDNSLNDRVENLYYGTAKDNAEDRSRNAGSQKLTSALVSVISSEVDGFEEVFDIAVEGPYHNFVAGGVVVHNSVNEYSTRYSEAIDSQQKTNPKEWRLQATSNKQGSSGFLENEWPEVELDYSPPKGQSPGEYLTEVEEKVQSKITRMYQERLRFGIAKEQARKDLPLSTYTEAYWKIDLHNLLHFLSLRMDPHAQKEIRDYANVIGNEIVAKLFPITWEAFKDYRLEGMHLSRLETGAIETAANNMYTSEVVMEYLEREIPNKRERDECIQKLKCLGIINA